MFELIRSLSIDVEKGHALGEAVIAAEHPLFADHFPGAPILPGSLLIELAAQVSGPLAEEVTKLRLNHDRWAILGIIRDARFMRPVSLPATVKLTADVVRAETSTVTSNVSAQVNGHTVMRAELMLMMLEGENEWREAIKARNYRVARWKGAQ